MKKRRSCVRVRTRAPVRRTAPNERPKPSKLFNETRKNVRGSRESHYWVRKKSVVRRTIFRDFVRNS